MANSGHHLFDPWSKDMLDMYRDKYHFFDITRYQIDIRTSRGVQITDQMNADGSKLFSY